MAAIQTSAPQSGASTLLPEKRAKLEPLTCEQVAVDEEDERKRVSCGSNTSNCHLFINLRTFVETIYALADNWLFVTRHKQHQPVACCAAKRRTALSGSLKRRSLIVSIMLPLLFVFLLPSFELDISYDQQSRLLRSAAGSRQRQAAALEAEQLAVAAPGNPTEAAGSSQWSAFERRTSEHLSSTDFSGLLMALLRFPFDRLRLVSSGLGGVSAKETQSDLQEEETHMQLVQPAEHRSSYLSQGGPAQQVGYQANGSRSPQRLLEMGHNGAAGYQQAADGAGHPVAPEPQPTDYAIGGAGDGGGTSEPVEPGTVTIADSAGNGLQTRNDLPAVRALNVKCEKNHMMVNLVFDRPFYGTVFSKGHYNDQKCVHLPSSSGQTSVNFDIHLGRCGMTSSDANGNPHAMALHQQQLANNGASQQQPHGLYIENTIIIQYDPQVQEIYDQARKLRCTWYDYYEKSVSFKPYNVDMLDAVTANFLGDNIQCWMQIQVGKGPWSSEVAGIVKIGQTMTMVLAIKDDENRFDMLVRNCVAHDGKHPPIQLVDEYGCVARPKIMAKFQKVKNFGPAATVVSYAHFQAFKFPDSMSVHFQCVIQVCRYECPEPVCSAQSGAGSAGQLGGVAMDQTGGPTPTDYAASGTEIVASKEPLALSSPAFFLANQSSSSPASTQGSAINLKLDEAQGRVQVKLDTSMMAGLGQQQQHQNGFRAHTNGPYPPHLLHLAGSASAESRPVGGIVAAPTGRGGTSAGHTFMSSSYQNKPISGQQQLASQTSSRPPLVAYGSRPAQATVSSHPALHYSSPYQQRTAYATNRLGEQAPPVGAETEVVPLSLIASPRALPNGQMPPGWSSGTMATSKSMAALNHRYRRSLAALNSTAMKTLPNSKAQDRKERDARQESTAIRTQKTIQVVSPDDVSFSLLSDDSELDPLSVVTGTPFRRPAQMIKTSTAGLDHLSTVCFSAAKLVVAVLVTLAALAASIVIVAFVIMRQRSKLEAAKLSDVYETTTDQVGSSLSLISSESAALQQQHQPLRLDGRSDILLHRHVDYSGKQQQPKMVKYQHEQHKRHCSPTATSRQDDEIMAQRQNDEIQQRNKCLARLYSQFVPAAYWR